MSARGLLYGLVLGALGWAVLVGLVALCSRVAGGPNAKWAALLVLLLWPVALVVGRERPVTNDEAIALMFPNGDEFQRIALAACLDDVRSVPWPPLTSEDEQKLIRLGAIAIEVIEGTAT